VVNPAEFRLKGSEQQPTIVMIMVDGTRPDVVEKMMAEGQLNNIKRYFMEGGSYFENSFTPLSLTVPSWSTILTGMDIDRTGIKGNDTFNRKTKLIDNYLDIRKDIIYSNLRDHGRAYRKVREAGVPLIMDRMYRGGFRDAEGYINDDYGQDSEVFMSIFALNDQFPMYLTRTLQDNLSNIDLWQLFNTHDALIRLFFDYSAADSLDRDTIQQALKVIGEKRGTKKKLIGLYLQGLDHISHKEHERGRRYLQQVDYQIGRIFQALQSSRYQNSVVVLVSDHGSLGGQEYEIDNKYNPLRGENFALTSTNLSHYFSGWYNKPGYADYNFNVEAAIAAEGKFSLKNLVEFQLQPFQCTNVSRKNFEKMQTCANFFEHDPQGIRAAVLSNQSISLPYASLDSKNWKTPNNWYNLTHYTVGRDANGAAIVRNLIKDLEDFTLDNLMVFDSKLASKIGNRPLDWLAVMVNKTYLNASPSAKALGLYTEEDAVLINRNSSSQALILRKKLARGETFFRYLPIKNFEQHGDGWISFEPNDTNDPLNYLGNPWANRETSGAYTSDVDWFSEYHSDREWIGRYAKTAYPNTVPSLTRFMTFRGPIQKDQENLRADIYLNPRYGHYFAINNDTNEVNHGMWQRESVRNLFMITGPGVRKGYRAKTPVFAFDVIPTALSAAGYNSDSKSEGEEFWKQFDGKQSFEILEH
jgi:hypothetical protein